MTELNPANVSSHVFAFGFAVLGTGMIANDMGVALRRANDSVYCAAVGSRSKPKAEAFAKKYAKDGFPVAKAYASYEEAVKDSSVRGAYVALPTALKEEMVTMCLSHGKHVVVEKPFASLESITRMTDLAREKGLLLIDATHFVHNPRTTLLLEKLKEGIIGDVLSLQANFFTGPLPATNIRMDSTLEPSGAVGDLAWYTARAAVEVLLSRDAGAKVESVYSDNQLDGAATIQRASSIVRFSNGTRLTSGVGFCGSWEQGLLVVGSRGTLKVADFVLDRHNSGFFENPHIPLKFEVFYGKTIEPHATFAVGPWTETFEPLTPQRSIMFERFAKDACRGPEAAEFWAKRSKLTQSIVDAIFLNKVAAE